MEVHSAILPSLQIDEKCYIKTITQSQRLSHIITYCITSIWLLNIWPNVLVGPFQNPLRSLSLPVFSVSEGSPNWEECSRIDTPMMSESERESDKESEYMTGLEDISEVPSPNSFTSQSNIFKNLSDPSHTSSFIQSILYEDSRAGVAVVDLFVAIKLVKDKMDTLARCNNEVLKKITSLNQETVAIRAGYKNLKQSMQAFLDKIIDLEMTESVESENSVEASGSEQGSRRHCEEERIRTESRCHCCCRLTERSVERCLNDKSELMKWLQSALGDNRETILESLLELMMWRQRERRVNARRILSQGQVGIKNLESIQLSDSNVQIICDICKTLLGSASQEAEQTPLKQTLPSRSKSKESYKSMESTGSEGESVFEEALTDLGYPNQLPPRHNVTCMGDLSTEIVSKKNVSTFTVNSDIGTSCMDNLRDDIKIQMRKIKSKAHVTVFNNEKSTKTLNKLKEALEFAITANTAVGVFDVTVLQFRKRRGPKERAESQEMFDNDIILAPDMSGSESGESGSDSGEGEMEEFMEVYVDSQNGHDKVTTAASMVVLLKLSIPNVFEIQKCYPTAFVLELEQKTAWGNSQSRGPEEEEEEVIALSAEDREQKAVVIQRSSSEMVIYIQVEMEERGAAGNGGVVVEYERSSLGTQTQEEAAQEMIRLAEDKKGGESLYQIWKSWENEERERITFEEGMVVPGEELGIKEENLEKEVVVQEPTEERSKVSEGGRSGLVMWGQGSAWEVERMEAEMRAEVWWVVEERCEMEITEEKKGVQKDKGRSTEPLCGSVELVKAMQLIHEIESDVMEVKLSDAISILPRLEFELRKHLQNKMKSIGEAEPGKEENSVENFFSAVDFWPDEDFQHDESYSSEMGLDNVLGLLSKLEEAVRANEYSNHRLSVCEHSSSKIYKLLRKLNESIRDLEESPNVDSLSQTLDIASQLDTVVREYDSAIKKQPVECDPKIPYTLPSNGIDDTLDNHRLINVRKKVFRIVEDEAADMEGRIERDFDRLDRIERENDESMMFLEAFLKKTERRAAELGDMKNNLKELSSSMAATWEKMQAKVKRALIETAPQQPEERIPVNETVSGLLIALDNLKARAREKKEICRVILSSVGFDKSSDSERSSRRSSRSSFTARQAETITSKVTELKKIGDTSLYLSWTKPEGCPGISVLGYEIHVNGTLNQKVRNPLRLQAVLYSVDLSKDIDVCLYAMVESGSRILLASASYLDE